MTSNSNRRRWRWLRNRTQGSFRTPDALAGEGGVGDLVSDERPAERWRALLERADGLAVRAARRPLAALTALVAVNLTLAFCFVGIGLAMGDAAEPFRELAPATWLSFGELLFVATAAWAIHVRAGRPRWHQDFWGLAAAAFLVFAVDEITQAGMFFSMALDELGLQAAAGFRDLDSVLLTLLFATVALVLLPRVGVLLRHRWALVVLGVAVALGAASQALDSFVSVSESEFVAEETFKLASEAFFVGGFLLALRDVLKDAAGSGRGSGEGLLAGGSTG